jgi:hypothetical protein
MLFIYKGNDIVINLFCKSHLKVSLLVIGQMSLLRKRLKANFTSSFNEKL